TRRKGVDDGARSLIESEPDQSFALLIGDSGVTESKQQATRPGRRDLLQAPNGVGKFDGVIQQACGFVDTRRGSGMHELSLRPEARPRNRALPIPASPLPCVVVRAPELPGHPALPPRRRILPSPALRRRNRAAPPWQLPSCRFKIFPE